MRKIYTVPNQGQGVLEFVSHVRTLGNKCLNSPTSDFIVYARNEYPETTTNAEIVFNEIQGAVDELKTVNELGKTVPDEERPKSLSDILKTRQAIVEETPVVAQSEEEPSTENDPSLPEKEEDLDNTDLSYDDAEDNADLTAIKNAAQQLNDIRKANILRSLEHLLQTSFVTDTDVLHQLSEMAALKKTLSAVLSKMGVTVSMTAISPDFKTKTNRIEFRPDTVVSPEHYRLGVSELFRVVDEMLENSTKFEEMQQTLRKVEFDLSSLRHNSSETQERLKQEVEHAKREGIPHEITAARYNVTWQHEGVRYYLAVRKDAQKTDKGDYSSKNVGRATDRKFAHFYDDLAVVRTQIERIKAYPQNFGFMPSPLPELRIARVGFDYVS